MGMGVYLHVICISFAFLAGTFHPLSRLLSPPPPVSGP